MGGYERKPGAGNLVDGALQPQVGPGGVGPGKQSLTSQLPHIAGLVGVDASAVRVHEDGVAEGHGARAVAMGTDVHFARGELEGPDRDFLLGHELAHVVQQKRGAAGAQAKRGGPDHAALEVEADRAGHAVARGEPAGVIEGRAAFGAPQRNGGRGHGPRFTMVEQDDHLVASDADNTVVGWKSGDAWLVAVAHAAPVALDRATIGQLSGSHAARVVEMRKVTGHAGAWVMADRSSAMIVEGDPAAARVLGELATGSPGHWQLHGMHGAANVLPAGLAAIITENDKLELGSQFFEWMTYPDGLTTASTSGWATTGHTRREVDTRVQNHRAVADQLPEPLRQEVIGHIEAIAVVSTVEGSFDATSGQINDTSGSLGIFQWARSRDPAGGRDSLDKFFVAMARRAHEAERKARAGQAPTAEEQVAVSAWQQAEAMGIGVDGNRVTIRHNGGAAKNAGGLDLELAAAGSAGLDDSFQVSQAVRHGRNIDDALTSADHARREAARRNPRAAVSVKDARIADNAMLDGVVAQLTQAARDVLASDLVQGDRPHEDALRAQITALTARGVEPPDPHATEDQQLAALDAARRDRLTRITNATPVIRGIIDRKLRSAPQMATPEMKNYQLVAALDWIKEFQTEPVIPTYSNYMSHALPGASIGSAAAQLTRDRHVLHVVATPTSTVGDHFTTERGLAEVAMIGVNRPAYVATALWAALLPGLPTVEINARIDRIFAAVRALDHDVVPAQLTEAELVRQLGAAPAAHQDAAKDALAALTELKARLWPAAGQGNEEQLITRYRAEVMRIYNVVERRDADGNNRVGRMVTVDMIDWDAVEAAKARAP
jgi:hypothetical protein